MLNKQPQIHIGELIAKVLYEKHISRAELARRLKIKSQYIKPGILEKPSLQTDVVQRINTALECNLFEYFIDPSERGITIKDCDSSQIAGHDFYNQSDINEIVNLKKQIELLEARLRDKDEMIELLKKSLASKA